MVKNDELDRSRARQFARGVTPPALDEEESPGGDMPLDDDLAANDEEDEEDDGALDDEWRARAREACGLLADGVLRVRAMTDLAKQSAATAELVRRAAELGLGAVGMKDRNRSRVDITQHGYFIASLGEKRVAPSRPCSGFALRAAVSP